MTILVFLGFCHSLGKIAKKEEKVGKNKQNKYIKMRCKCECVNILWLIID